eukprot:gnl/TRDRNA2_/TRDRNA2_179802_c0_seq1.p2 gnl/TRDRNA2_/TRDRNA2_179802_c0~~gnl/TRDRNA2_/TRDRNA2_179802_c0_seq1.p2  ORF type:complete len:178 (-),score=41.68 gnl/TRDRNA2_/TRDRNA2_179802_c0_seq1:192-725(-)
MKQPLMLSCLVAGLAAFCCFYHSQPTADEATSLAETAQDEAALVQKEMSIKHRAAEFARAQQFPIPMLDVNSMVKEQQKANQAYADAAKDMQKQLTGGLEGVSGRMQNVFDPLAEIKAGNEAMEKANEMMRRAQEDPAGAIMDMNKEMAQKAGQNLYRGVELFMTTPEPQMRKHGRR